MKLSELYKQKKPGLSFEIFPPKRDSFLSDIEPTLEIMADLKPDYIGITFGAGGSVANNKTIEIARLIKEKYHVEPMVHMTCLNYNKADIDEYASMMVEYGIDNCLALRGDRREGEEPKKDFAYACDLTAYLRSKWDFCIAGGCYPEGHPECGSRKKDMDNLKKKVDAGDELLISQLFLDNEFFYDFKKGLDERGISVPVTPGIMPVINSAQFERMSTLCGASIPARFRRIMDRYEDNPEALFDAGLYYMTSQVIDLIASGTDGIHLYTMNRPSVAKRLAEAIHRIIL